MEVVYAACLAVPNTRTSRPARKQLLHLDCVLKQQTILLLRCTLGLKQDEPKDDCSCMRNARYSGPQG